MTASLKRSLLIAVSAFLCLAVLEIFLWAIRYTYTPVQVLMRTEKNEWKPFFKTEQNLLRYDPDLIWRPRGDGVIFNAQGYRGEVLPAGKKPGSFLIFAIGDSNTAGQPWAEDSNWPEILHRRLREKNDRSTVVNAGVWGYSSLQELRRFEEALRFQPDMVLISVSSNDWSDAPMSDQEFTRTKIRRLKLDRLLNRFRIGQIALQNLDKLSRLLKEKDGGIAVPRVSVQDYKEILTTAIRLARDKQIEVILLTRPLVVRSDLGLLLKDRLLPYNAAAIEIGERSRVKVIDLHSHFKDREEYFFDETHFNQKGNREAAEVIYKNIRRLIRETDKS